MERREFPTSHKQILSSRNSKKEIQAKLENRREMLERRRERKRIQQEEARVQKLEEERAKKSADKSYFTKQMKNERRSYILGMPNSPTNEKSWGSPRIDSRRQQYNKAMRRLEDSYHTSRESSTSPSSVILETRNAVRLPQNNHSNIYHSSQFKVSNLVPSIHKERLTAICRICQSDEDSLSNQLLTPCSCIGSLRYVHHLCLEQWRKTKRASGADISKCELCLQNYDTDILGDSDVKPDLTLKMQEDLRRLVRSGVYLMLLVDFCRDSFEDLLNERNAMADQTNSTPVEIRPTTGAVQTSARTENLVCSDVIRDNGSGSSKDSGSRC